MKQEQAREVYHQISGLGRGWAVVMPEKEKYGRTVNWTVSVEQRHNLSRRFTIPQGLLDVVCEDTVEMITVDATEERAKIVLDNTESEELEMTEEEREFHELKRAIRDEFDVNQEISKALANEYESVDEILAADREELKQVPGIGERRATKILHRHSDKLKERIEETSQKRTIAAVEDEDGILRLPEELE